MRYSIILTSLICCLINTKVLFAQEDTTKVKSWKKGIATTLNFSNVGVTNWAGGGQNSLSLTSLLTAYANYNKGKLTWLNSTDLGYGLLRQGEGAVPFRKSDDKIVLISKFAYGKGKKVKVSALLDFRTQFADGVKYSKSETTGKDTSTKISTFLAPGYMTNSVGIEYNPSKSFYLFYSPVTAKYTFVNDDELSAIGAYGVKRGEKFRAEFGTMLSSKINLKIMENITFSSVLNLFSNYENFNVDVFWDTGLLMKVNKLVTVSFTTNLIYDDDIDIVRKDKTVGPATQFKNVLSVGLVYKLDN